MDFNNRNKEKNSNFLNNSDFNHNPNSDFDDKEDSNYNSSLYSDFNNLNTKNNDNTRDNDRFNNDNDDDIIPELLYDDMRDENILVNRDINRNKNNNVNNKENEIFNSSLDINQTQDTNQMGNINRPVDVRIIVDGPEKSEFLSKAIKKLDLLDNFNIIISSIITTNNVEIAKNASVGSNIILIALTPDEEGENLFNKFYSELKTNFNYVEFLKFPKLRDIEITDIKNVENEVKNSIIRSALKSIFDISNINQVKSELFDLNNALKESQATNEKISLENDMLVDEANQLRKNNKKLNQEIRGFQNHIDQVKLDFADFKSRYSNIHSRNLLEIFLIRDLWMEIFDESLSDEEVDKTVIATNKFRPENVLVGQDYIAAVSKEDAIDWLKIIKTALIFVEKDNNKLQEEMINY